MKYDFNTPIDRRGTDSLKWDVGENELPMWVADMDFETAPAVKEAVMRRAAHGIYGYTLIPDKWYDAITGWWRERHGFMLERDWLCFCTGVIPAISSAVKRVTNVGDRVVLLTPVYDIFYHSVENAGRTVLESRLSYRNGEYDIDFYDLEKKLSDPLCTMMILCNPHNPVGKIWTPDELADIDLLEADASAALKDWHRAEALYSQTARNFTSLAGSKAAVALGERYLSSGKAAEAEKLMTEFTDAGSPHEYWLARGYIVLADALTARGDKATAREYLESLRENYPGSESDIFKMIDSRLKKLKK